MENKWSGFSLGPGWKPPSTHKMPVKISCSPWGRKVASKL